MVTKLLKLEYNVSRLCKKNTPKTLNLRQIMKVQNNNSVQEQDGNSSKPLKHHKRYIN